MFFLAVHLALFYGYPKLGKIHLGNIKFLETDYPGGLRQPKRLYEGVTEPYGNYLDSKPIRTRVRPAPPPFLQSQKAVVPPSCPLQNRNTPGSY